jgi:competence protein ComEC
VNGLTSPALTFLAGLLCATLFFHQQANLGTITYITALILWLISAIAFIWTRWAHRASLACGATEHKRNNLIALCAACLGASIAWSNALFQAEQRLADKLSPSCEGLTRWSEVLISELPTATDLGMKWIGEVSAIKPSENSDCKSVPKRVSISWISGYSAFTAGTLPELHVGDVWRLPLSFKRTVAPLQFEGFDVESYWFANEIGATASVKAKLARIDGKRLNNIRWSRFDLMIQTLREQLRSRINTALTDAPNRAVLVALVLGDQRGISAADWSLFSATGIGHLVSISGMHITLFAALAGWLCMLAWRRSAWLCLRIPAPKAGAVTGLAAALFYCALAGWGIPAQRTVFMLAAVVIAVVIQTRPSPIHILSFAASVLVLLDPWAAQTAGFWLSFGAVALLMYANVGRFSMIKSRWDTLRQAVWTQWTVTIGLVPLTVMLFSQLSLISPLANAVAIPWVTFVVTPLAMLGTFFGVDAFLQWGDQALSLLFSLLRPLSQLSYATVPAATPPIGVYILSIVGSLWALAPKGVPGKPLGVFLVAILWWWPASRPSEGAFWMEVLDIGQGNAIAIQTRDKTLIYDTGPAMNPSADSGARVILPWLWRQGLKRPDGLVISHQDNDHAGGAHTILKQAAPQWVSSSLPSDHPLIADVPKHIACRAGQAWVWNNVHFEFIFPTDDDFTPSSKPNDTSCSLKISSPYGTALLVGDIGIAQEKRIIERYGTDKLKTDVLIVPHHGSKTSSSEAFIDAVSPRFAVFQMGYRNRYGHPKPEVWERYAARPIAKLRTDATGALRFQFIKVGHIQSVAAKQIRQRYWHTPAL